MGKNLIFLLFFLPHTIFSQFLAQKQFTWEDKFVDYKELPDSLKKNDAVILKETITITANTIYKRVAIKILTQKGLDAFKKIQLPENFDLTYYPNLYKQGRLKNIYTPYISSIEFFAARIITPNKNIVDLPSEYNREGHWINTTPRKTYEEAYGFKIDILEIGDILEYTYKVDSYQNIIYPNSIYPKLDYSLKIVWQTTGNYTRKPSTFHYNYLKRINYPQNLQIGLALPNIPINMGSGSQKHPHETQFVRDGYIYKWYVSFDPVYNHYSDNYHQSIRKFVDKFGENRTDTFNVVFLKQLTDTINGLKFISDETIHDQGETQNTPLFPDIFSNREIKEEKLFKNYEDILAEKKIFFYTGVIMDKRLSAVNPKERTHMHLECTIIVIPHKSAFKYIVPRYNGLKYVLDELPFYFEGTTCVLLPCYNCPGNDVNTNVCLQTNLHLCLDSVFC